MESEAPITMYIGSGGGLVYAGLAVYDVMQYIRSPVNTVCIGHCESMAAILLAGGEPGGRSSLPSARIMLHQVGAAGNGDQHTAICIPTTPHV